MDGVWWLLIGVGAVGAAVIVFFLLRLGKAVTELRRTMVDLGEAGAALDKLRNESNGIGDSIDKLRRR